MLSLDPSVVQEVVVAREALSESQTVGVWVDRHHNLEVALAEEVPSYLDALDDPLGDQTVLWEGHPWVEEACRVEVVLLVEKIQVDQVVEAPFLEVLTVA